MPDLTLSPDQRRAFAEKLGLDPWTIGYEGVVEDLDLTGHFEDRTRTTRHEVTVLSDAGLTDELIAAREVAARRAWLDLIPGRAGEVQIRRKRMVEYRPVVQNRGPTAAANVIVELHAAEDGTGRGASRIRTGSSRS